MEIKAVRQERLYIKVAEQLSGHIDNGDIAIGDRLPSERDLAERFGVSRPTIREAMIALELAGRVEIRSGSGVYVLDTKADRLTELPDDAPGPLELLEARYYFESDAAALAAERASEKDIKSIQKALQAMQAENRQYELHEEADEQFHLLIAKASGNSAIHSAVSRLWDQRRTSTMSVFFHEKLRKQGIKPVIHDHKAILEGIRNQDADAARSAMRTHLQRVIDVIVNEDDAAA